MSAQEKPPLPFEQPIEDLAEPILDGLEGKFTPRESELLGRAGDRIFNLARRLGAADREIDRLKADLAQRDEVLAETRKARDVLSLQVESLLRERERDYDERAELRQLFVTSQVQLQAVLDRLAPPVPEPTPAAELPGGRRQVSPGRRQITHGADNIVARVRRGWRSLMLN